MKAARQIKAYLFLIIISVCSAHNAFSHVHAHDDEHGEHNEQQAHHHIDTPQQGHYHHSHDEDGFRLAKILQCLIESHSHSTHVHEYSPVTTPDSNTLKQVDHKLFVHQDFIRPIVRSASTGQYTDIPWRVTLLQTTYLGTHLHRGPPALG